MTLAALSVVNASTPAESGGVIHRLPALLVNQIAAGEVIDRPASVVKELVENALDAGAKRISIAIEQGGRELISVSDDGCGMEPTDLSLAVEPHATSKISAAKDLDAIATLGFRGEALASIASVSRLTLRSRTRRHEGATRIEAEGSAIGAAGPAAGSAGTTVMVRNLFFNTPARRKFLRGEQTEFNHISELVERMALGRPAVGFSLSHDERMVLEFPADQSPKERILEVLGRELAGELLEVSRDGTTTGAVAAAISLWGVVGTPAVARGHGRQQHVFLNGRSVRDKTILHAVKEAYRGLVDPTRYPLVVLYVDMDPGQVDVNVHPTKAEVRFRDSQAVHGIVLTALRERLLAADLTPSAGANAGVERAWPLGDAAAKSDEGGGIASARAFVEHFKSMDPVKRGFVYEEVRQVMGAGAGDDPINRAPADGGAESPGPALAAAPRPVQRILQVHQSYLVLEDSEGILIIDQHALHERVMFEELSERIIAGGRLESQRLLMPVIVEIGAAPAERLDSLAGLFERVGIEARLIGPTSLAIHAFPSFLFERDVEPGPFVLGVLDRAAVQGFDPDAEGALAEVLNMMSCKAAVKAGDRLTEAELESLLERRDRIERGGSCPHGRPTTIRLSLRDLEKRFARR